MAINWKSESSGNINARRNRNAPMNNAATNLSQVLQGRSSRLLEERKQNAVEQEYADKRQDVVDTRQRDEDKLQEGITRDGEIATSLKGILNNTQRRFNSKAFQGMLPDNAYLASLTKEQRQGFQKEFAEENRGTNFRTADNARSELTDALYARGDMSTKQIETAVNNALRSKYPTASEAEMTGQDKITNLESGRRDSYKSAKQKQMSSDDMIDSFEADKNIDRDLVSLRLDPTSTWADRGKYSTGISMLRSEDFDDLDIKNAINQAVRDNGRIKGEYDWTDEDGKGYAALRALTQKSANNNGRTRGGNSGNKSPKYVLSDRERLKLTKESLASLSNQGVDGSELMSALETFARGRIAEQDTIGPRRGRNAPVLAPVTNAPVPSVAPQPTIEEVLKDTAVLDAYEKEQEKSNVFEDKNGNKSNFGTAFDRIIGTAGEGSDKPYQAPQNVSISPNGEVINLPPDNPPMTPGSLSATGEFIPNNKPSLRRTITGEVIPENNPLISDTVTKILNDTRVPKKEKEKTLIRSLIDALSTDDKMLY